MESYEEPKQTGFTIYSKSGCNNCLIAKNFLSMRSIEFNVINCDDYLIENRDGFITFINTIAKQPTGNFPKIFKDGNYIGSYKETKELVDKTLVFEDNLDF